MAVQQHCSPAKLLKTKTKCNQSDVKIDHREHGRVDEMGNAEKVMCLNFGGLQADGA